MLKFKPGEQVFLGPNSSYNSHAAYTVDDVYPHDRVLIYKTHVVMLHHEKLVSSDYLVRAETPGYELIPEILDYIENGYEFWANFSWHKSVTRFRNIRHRVARRRVIQ